MPTEYTMTDLCAVRLSRRDATGAIDYENPLGAVYLTAPQELTWSDEIETGEEYLEKTGCNTIGYYDKEDDLVKSSTGTLAVTRASFQAYELMEIAGLVTVSSEVVGFRATGGISCGQATTGTRNGVVLEAWGKLKECAVAGSGSDTIFRVVFPKTRWTRGERRMGRGPSIPTFNFQALPGKVGLGPFLDLPPELDFPTDIDPYPWALLIDDAGYPTAPDTEYVALPTYAS